MPKTVKKATVTAVKSPEVLDDIMERGVVDIIPKKLFQKRLQAGERMKIYLGVDPTGPDIHIGHAVILRKLRQLQDLGHEIVLLIGDFTARIGDPTDRGAARTVLTHEEVLENAKSYKKQAAKILDFSSKSKNPATLEFNATWLDRLSFKDVIELTSKFTVQQMLERDMYQQRIKDEKPIYLHEFLYPVMQGYDSVAMDVDMEVGGNDQLFNMLTGRTLQKFWNKKEKIVMTFELLPGLDGRKMSKSYGNIIGVMDEPNDMFGKVMSLADELIPKYFLMCTDYSEAEVVAVEKSLKDGAHPKEVKIGLAKEIVKIYHSEKAAAEAEAEFARVFAEKKQPKKIEEYFIAYADKTIIDVLVNSGLAKSRSAARRLIEQGGVRLNDVKVEDINQELNVADGDVLQVGKRKFISLQS